MTDQPSPEAMDIAMHLRVKEISEDLHSVEIAKALDAFAAQAVARERERWEAALTCAACGGPYPNINCGPLKNAIDYGERVPCRPNVP